MKGYELYQQLQLNVSPNELDKILYHSSYQEQESSLRKINKEYDAYGRFIARAMLAIYAYENNICMDCASISKLIASNYSIITDLIYDKYNLEAYQYVCKGEEGKRHAELGARLLVVYYKQNGFLETYRFLLPFLKLAVKNDNHDYKTILQEYAQGKKLPFSYEIIDREGTDNAPIFVCQLTIGKEKRIGRGTSKKDAMGTVAKEYIKAKNIPVNSQKKQTRKTLSDPIKITSDRQKQLIKAVSMFKVNANDLPINYLNASFAHKSVQNEVKLQNQYVDNSVLTVIGAELMQIYVIDYLYATSDYEYLNIVREKGVYTKADNIAGILPDSWLNLLLASKSIRSLNESGYNSLKIDIFHSILASLVLCGVKKGDSLLEEKASNISFYLFDRVKENKIPDYATVVQEVVQAAGMQYEINHKLLANSTDHNTMYRANIVCWNKEIEIKKYGDGTSRKRANNVASHAVLEALLPHFEDNFDIKMIILKVLYPEEYLQLVKESWKIKKHIALLSDNNGKKKWFATVENSTNKKAYDISTWENGNKDGIVFSADEAKQLAELLDKIEPLQKEESEEPEVIEIEENQIDPLIQEVIEGKEETLSSKLTKEQKLEIIRAELIAGNSFEGYEGNNEKLLPHQKAACRIADLFDKFAFFYDTGTGKTVLALDIITSKAKKDGASFLIICPKPIIMTAWMDDQKNFYPEMKLNPMSQNVTLRQYLDINRRWNELDGRSVFNDYLYYADWMSGSKANQLKYVRSVMIGKAKHYIVNPESFVRNIEFYKTLGVKGLIVDESSILKNYSSKISKAVREFADTCKYVYLLSGKPAPNNTMEYFSQMKVVAPNDFPMSYDAYKRKYYVNINNKIVCKSTEAEKEVSDLIGKHSIVVSKADCLVLPDTVHMVRKITLDKEVMKKYESMYRDYFINIEQQEKESKKNKKIYNVNNKLASLMKLRQLVSGFLLDSEGNVTAIHEYKEAELLRILDEIGDEQVIIWCQFKYEIQKLKVLLESIGKIVVTAYSDTKDKDESIRRFKEREADIILAHPKTLQYGVTFVNCRYAVYYSLSYSFEEYYQSHDRIYRYGQKNICSFIFLQAEGTIDEVLYDCVQGKKEDAAIFELLVKDASEHNIFVR